MLVALWKIKDNMAWGGGGTIPAGTRCLTQHAPRSEKCLASLKFKVCSMAWGHYNNAAWLILKCSHAHCIHIQNEHILCELTRYGMHYSSAKDTQIIVCGSRNSQI